MSHSTLEDDGLKIGQVYVSQQAKHPGQTVRVIALSSGTVRFTYLRGPAHHHDQIDRMRRGAFRCVYTETSGPRLAKRIRSCRRDARGMRGPRGGHASDQHQGDMN